MDIDVEERSLKECLKTIQDIFFDTMNNLVKTIAINVITDALNKSHTGRPQIFSAIDILETMELMVRCHIPWRRLILNKGSYLKIKN